MDVREKLVELLGEVQETGVNEIPAGFGCNRQYITNEIVAAHLISHGVTVQEWISASEPPEEKGCYLVSVKHWLDGKPVTRESFWNGADWLSCYWGKGDRVELTPRVTHWQYLPQPPEGE